MNQKMLEHFEKITERYPGYSVNYGGEEEDRQKSMANLMVLFLFALITIYIILSSFFLVLPFYTLRRTVKRTMRTMYFVRGTIERGNGNGPTAKYYIAGSV